MPRQSLTQKQLAVIEEVAKRGKKEIDAECVSAVYNCKNPKSAYKICYNLRKKELVRIELEKRLQMVQEVIQNEGRKIVEILEEIFPKVERAKILVAIARKGDIKSKLEALKEINRIASEYPIEKEGLINVGELRITMSPPKKELTEGKIIETKQIEEGKYKEIREIKNGEKEKAEEDIDKEVK